MVTRRTRQRFKTERVVSTWRLCAVRTTIGKVEGREVLSGIKTLRAMSRRIASESEKNNLYDATKRARNFLGPMFEIPKFFLIP
jgi:hypothetical protein